MKEDNGRASRIVLHNSVIKEDEQSPSLFWLNLVHFFSPHMTAGMPQINRDYNTRCHCLQVESRIIPPESLRSIKLIPEGPHCPETEVM